MCPRHPALTTGSQLPSHTPSCTIIKGRKEGATIRPTIQPTTRPYETIRPYELTMDTRLRKLSIVGRMMFLYMLPNMLLKLTGSKCQARFSSNVDMDWRWSFEALCCFCWPLLVSGPVRWRNSLQECWGLWLLHSGSDVDIFSISKDRN